MGAGADDAIESRDKRRNKASKQIWESSDEETKAIREQLVLAKMPSTRATLNPGEIPWTDNWEIEDVPQDYPYVYVPQ